MSTQRYSDIIVTITQQIGIIKLNRPKTLNAFGGNLMIDVVAALRELNEHPDTVITVLTGDGRFFSAGADIKAQTPLVDSTDNRPAAKKVALSSRYALGIEMLRSFIDHKKVVVLALNGPGVGGGAAWFLGAADIVLCSDTCWLQVPFTALGLVPELGSAVNISQSMGVRRANDFLMLGRKLTATELEAWGVVNYIFPAATFHEDVLNFLRKQLEVNDGKSMMESKRLMNAPLRSQRVLAVHDAMDALAERYVKDPPRERFALRRKQLEAKKAAKSKI